MIIQNLDDLIDAGIRVIHATGLSASCGWSIHKSIPHRKAALESANRVAVAPTVWVQNIRIGSIILKRSGIVQVGLATLLTAGHAALTDYLPLMLLIRMIAVSVSRHIAD